MDHVDSILNQWALVRPDIDTSPMAVIGRLSRASAIVDAELAANFARHGVDAATFDVLATLVRQGEPHQMTPAALAADSMVTTSAVAQRLNRLDTLGLITRHPDPTDGRGKIVQLTPAGKEIVDQVLPDHLATEAHLLRHFDRDQRETLATLLSVLSATPVR